MNEKKVNYLLKQNCKNVKTGQMGAAIINNEVLDKEDC